MLGIIINLSARDKRQRASKSTSDKKYSLESNNYPEQSLSNDLTYLGYEHHFLLLNQYKENLRRATLYYFILMKIEPENY